MLLAGSSLPVGQSGAHVKSVWADCDCRE